MSVKEWTLLVGGALTLLLVAAILSRCFRIYCRLLSSLRDGQGKVWVEPLGLPDLMVSAVLMSWLGASAVYGFMRRASAPVVDGTLLESALLYGLVV